MFALVFLLVTTSAAAALEDDTSAMVQLSRTQKWDPFGDIAKVAANVSGSIVQGAEDVAEISIEAGRAIGSITESTLDAADSAVHTSAHLADAAGSAVASTAETAAGAAETVAGAAETVVGTAESVAEGVSSTIDSNSSDALQGPHVMWTTKESGDIVMKFSVNGLSNCKHKRDCVVALDAMTNYELEVYLIAPEGLELKSTDEYRVHLKPTLRLGETPMTWPELDQSCVPGCGEKCSVSYLGMHFATRTPPCGQSGRVDIFKGHIPGAVITTLFGFAKGDMKLGVSFTRGQKTLAKVDVALEL